MLPVFSASKARRKIAWHAQAADAEPPDMEGGHVFSAQGASRSRNHSARRQGKTVPRNGTLENSYGCSVYGRFFDCAGTDFLKLVRVRLLASSLLHCGLLR